MSAAIEPPIKPTTRPSVSDQLKARKLFLQGIGSMRQIAEELGLKYDTVRTWASQNDWPSLRTEYLKRDLERALGPELPPQPSPQESQTPTQETGQASRLAAQLQEIEEQMKGAGPDTLAKLSIAHDRLFRAWQILSGTPNPGSRKVRQERSPRSAGRSLAGPMEAAAGPAPASPGSQAAPEPLKGVSSTLPVDKPLVASGDNQNV